MGLMTGVMQFLFGDGRNIVAETAEVFRENAEQGAVRAADARSQSLSQFAAEFALPPRGVFDRVIDGVDQTDLLLGKSEAGNRQTYVYMAHASRKKNIYAVNGLRVGKWKYLKAEQVVHGFAVDDDREEVEELYDLESDLGETTNLADQHPEIVKQLREQMQQWWSDAGKQGGLTGQ